MNNDGKIVDDNGKVYDIDQFKQNQQDGYIYGPTVRIQKDKEGNHVKVIDNIKMAPGIYREGDDGQLYGPEGQKYGHKDQVLGFIKNPVYKRSLNSSNNNINNDQNTNGGLVDNRVGHRDYGGMGINQLEQSILNKSSLSQNQTKREQNYKQLVESINTLQNGVCFTKYGMNDFFRGTKRKVFVDKTLRFICWTNDLTTESIDL